MYLHLGAEVTIGKITMKSLVACEIVSSWKELTDTAVITLPRNLKYKNKRIDQYINQGDQVTIQLGANGNLNTEFVGYVREVEPSMPLKIYCEDEMLNLKTGSITKSWTNAKLSDILNYVLAQVGLSYPLQVNDTTVGSFSCRNSSAAQVLYDLRSYGLYSYFRTINGVLTLYSGFPYSWQFDKVIYHFQKNVKKDDLKFRKATDYKIRVKAIANLPSGKKTIVYFPSQDEAGTEIRTLNFGELSKDENERIQLLNQFAEAERAKFNVDGYRGSLTGFAIPWTKHGDEFILRNDRYPEYSGNYICDKVTVRFGEVYLERINEVGPKAA